MGIPKFYRWLSERYPLLNQPTDVGETPLVDNLYLDMNGIIHNCTHGNDPGTKLTEEEMVVKIFGYLDKLFQVVKPQRLLFMAIDGVAPRAKMNQQRSRRFRSARDAEEGRAEAVRKGEVISQDAFDSNCITPGTPFMARLGAHLRYFVRKKIAEDPAWQRPHVIFSGHDVPGEGEHKIMEHIRHQKRLPGYIPNQRHCLYGLDADLIMLALVTHEPHFCLLREVVSFSGGSRGRPSREVLENPCQESFILFQIGLLREYLELEFRSDTLPFAFDVERVIDDFVLFCMLIGNDFLPALPTLDIAEGALDKLFGIYKQLLPSMGGYLNHAGELNRGRLEMVLHQLAALELNTLEQRAQDAEFMEQKKTERAGQGANAWQPKARQQELDEEDRFQVELDAMNGADELKTLSKLEPEEEEGATMMGRKARELMLSGQGDAALQAFKSKYYSDKLGLHKNDAAARRKVAGSFIEGLHWVLEYYYRGVASWTWFYPHHYAPMISEMVAIKEFEVAFQLGQPFLPFQQLLGVLPSASFKLLPEPYQWLMTDANSPIDDFYPTDFRVDMEGKRNDWEGVVLIPFIDEARLLAASHTVGSAKLSREEANRNKLGDLLVFSHQPDSQEDSFCLSTLPAHFATVTRCNSRCQFRAPPPPLPLGERGFTPQVVEGTKLGPGGPAGYPTLKTLSLTAQLQQAGVEVFGQGSRKESLILKVQDKMSEAVAAGMVTAEQIAGSVLGERCWVRWPFLQEALVQAVSDRTQKVDRLHGVVPHGEREAQDWAVSSSQLTRQFMVKHGMDIGRSELVLHVRVCEGLMRQLDGTVEKRFAKKEILYPLQASLRRNPAPDPRRDPSTVGGQLGALKYEVGQKGLFLGRGHYGCVATVLPTVSPGLSRKGVKLPPSSSSGNMLHIEVAPAALAAATAQATARRMVSGVRPHYLPSGQVARRLHMSSRTLGKLTGNLWLQTGEEKVDLGLFVKHGGKGMCVPDYVQAQPDNNGWAYSQALITIIEQYKAKHSWVFTMVEQNPDSNDYHLSQVFPELDKEAALKKMKDAKAWLTALPLFKRPLVKSGAQVMAEDAIRALQAALPPALAKPMDNIELENVRPTLLLSPTEKGGIASELAGGAFDLADRVACLTSTGSPPLGSRGTVVGVHEGALEVMFDHDFIGGGDLQGRCHGRCGIMLPPSHLLNLAKPQFANLQDLGAGGEAPVQVSRGEQPPWSQSSQQPVQAQPGVGLGLGQGLGSPQPRDALSSDTTAGPAANGSVNAFSSPVQPRALPRPKAHQPQCPPDKDARGFTMGRGRALPSVPGASLLAAKPSAPAPGASALHPSGTATSAEQPAAASAAAAQQPAVNIGHQLLSQLQGQGTTSDSGTKIGQHLLSQLQVQGSSRSASQAGPNAGQQLLMQLQGQAAIRAPAGAVLGQGFLQQLQSAGGAPSPVIPQDATGSALHAQTDAGQALLAQLQRPLVQSQQAVNSLTQPVAQPLAQPLAQGYQDPGASKSFQQLLRGATAAQRPVAQPMAEPVAQFAAEQQHRSNGGAPSFNQLLQSAMAQQQPPQPPPGFARPPQLYSTSATASATTLAGPPGFAVSHQLPARLQQSAAAVTDPGRLLLQQLQGGGLRLQGGALGQQPQGVPAVLSQQLRGGPLQGGAMEHQPQGVPVALNQQQQRPAAQPRGSREAGQKLLQQLQRTSLSANGVTTSTWSHPSASIGAAVDAPQPVPSAPPAPQAVLLQTAADDSAISKPSGQAGVSSTFIGSTARSEQSANAPGLQGTAAGKPGRASRSGLHPRTGRGQHYSTVHSNQLPAQLSTGVQKQQPAAAAASHDRHRQHHRQQQRSLNAVEPDSAVQVATEKVWEPQQQQQQVQLLQRNAGSRHDQDNTAPQAPDAAQPEQTGAGAGTANGPTAPNLDVLWAKLQQQHSLEAEAARLTRRSNSGAVPTGSNSKAESLNTAAEQATRQQAVSKETDSSTSGRVDAVTEGPVSSLPTLGTQQQQQQMSEADFWQMMQK